MAYLIEVIGLSREVAKALLIDSATGWHKSDQPPYLVGHGVVPIRIEDILKTPTDEIKFIIDGSSEKFETYNYNIPVPESNNKHPFVARATLCYFPNCSRNQGVDYTNTEMDIHFGRLEQSLNGTRINTINENRQSEDCYISLYEGTARALYRKWDNVKHIRENIVTEKGNPRKPKMKKGNGLWGVSIKTKERLDGNDGRGLRFGLVVTLKEVNGVNRIDDFIQNCQIRGWLVNRIDVHSRVNIYSKAEEKIIFD